jgi:hypothetical protein
MRSSHACSSNSPRSPSVSVASKNNEVRTPPTPPCHPPPIRPKRPSPSSKNLRQKTRRPTRPSAYPATTAAARTSAPDHPLRSGPLPTLWPSPAAKSRPGRPRTVLASGRGTAAPGRADHRISRARSHLSCLSSRDPRRHPCRLVPASFGSSPGRPPPWPTWSAAIASAAAASRRLLRAVLWRKGCLGSSSEGGCRFVARILTVVQTLRLQSRPVLTYLCEALCAHREGLPAPKLLSAA